MNKPYGLACMKYYCHVWASAISCFLEMLDKLQNQICGTVGPSLVVSSESSTHRQNVAFLNLGITLLDVYLNWLN